MFNLNKLLAGMTPTDWVLICCCLIAWAALTYFMGVFSEKKWGDRESGALIGFFVPSLIFTLVLYVL